MLQKITVILISLIMPALILVACTGVISPAVSEQAPAQASAAADNSDTAGEEDAALELGENAAQSPAEIITATKDKISAALAAYTAGETDAAYEWAADAYLDGFEHIEDSLLQQGEQELVETLELQFKAFRDGIKAGQTPDQLQTLATKINAQLDEVEGTLE